MALSFVDLHCHSTASDGTLSPTELIGRAKEIGLSAIALTDHDTIAGVDEAQRAARETRIDFLPGIEISCEFPRPGTLHLLGYGIDPKSDALARLTRTLIDGRDRRNREMIAKLNAGAIPITLEEVQNLAGGKVIGRPHLAAALVNRNIVANTAEAFKLYLGQGGSVWIDKEQLTARQAIALIHEAGGVAIVAHPSQLRRSNNAELRATIKDLIDVGLDGIEVIHSDHSEVLIDQLIEIARQWNLLASGGSDFHGDNKKHIKLGLAGTRKIPRAMYENIKEALERRRLNQSSQSP